MAWRSFLLLALLSLSVLAVADILTFRAFDSGHYYPDGVHYAENRSYAAGQVAQDPVSLRNFFFFRIEQPITEQIVSASMTLFPGVVIGSDWYNLTDLTLDPDIVRADHAAGDSLGIDVYSDLITGFSYGTTLVSENDETVDIQLTSKALQDLSTAEGIFGIGGYMRPGSHNLAFLETDGFRPTLLVETVSEPTSLELLLASLIVFLIVGQRRRAVPA